MDRVGRALAQRLFLVQRRDISRGPAGVGGAASTEAGGTSTGPDDKWHAVFAVFGTTGNVYRVHVCANPSCTCPDFAGDLRSGGGASAEDAAADGGHICKHLLWVYMRSSASSATTGFCARWRFSSLSSRRCSRRRPARAESRARRRSRP